MARPVASLPRGSWGHAACAHLGCGLLRGAGTSGGGQGRSDNLWYGGLAEAKLSRTWRVHDLRHDMATHWLASGINAKIVSERLGHASVAVILQVYAHALPN